LPAENAQAEIWDKARSMTYINQAQDPTAFAGAIKSVVTTNILADMQSKGITFEDMYKNQLNQTDRNAMSFYDEKMQEAFKFMVSGTKYPESGIGSNYEIIVSNPERGLSIIDCQRFGIDPNEPITKEEFLQKVEETPYFKNIPDSWAILDSEKAKDVACQDKVSSLLRSWANSANDDNLTSLAMQEVATKTFNLQNTAEWTSTNQYSSKAQVADEIKNNGKIYEAFLTSQYDATQQFFKDRNISSLEIYRGVIATDPSEKLPTGDNVEVTARPLSSWSTSEDTASWFASADNAPAVHADKYLDGAIFHAIVPASQVFALPITGIGCYGENEVVLLGGTFKTDSQDYASWFNAPQ
jgi:hypothetical protein